MPTDWDDRMYIHILTDTKTGVQYLVTQCSSTYGTGVGVTVLQD